MFLFKATYYYSIVSDVTHISIPMMKCRLPGLISKHTILIDEGEKVQFSTYSSPKREGHILISCSFCEKKIPVKGGNSKHLKKFQIGHFME